MHGTSTCFEHMGCGVSRRVEPALVPSPTAQVVLVADAVPDAAYDSMSSRIHGLNARVCQLQNALSHEKCRVTQKDIYLRLSETREDSLTVQLAKQKKVTEEWEQKWSQGQDRCRALSQTLQKKSFEYNVLAERWETMRSAHEQTVTQLQSENDALKAQIIELRKA